MLKTKQLTRILIATVMATATVTIMDMVIATLMVTTTSPRPTPMHHSHSTIKFTTIKSEPSMNLSLMQEDPFSSRGKTGLTLTMYVDGHAAQEIFSHTNVFIDPRE